MSSGTFGYPLGFTAMLVAIGLVVLPHSDTRAPVANTDATGSADPGRDAFARKKPDAALAIFEVALKKPGNSRFNEAKLGKLQALVDLDQLEAAEKLALEIVGDKQFRGETAAKAYLQLARIYRKQAAKAQGEVARDLLRKAHGIYQRVFIAYKSFPELGEEANLEAAEVLKELAK